MISDVRLRGGVVELSGLQRPSGLIAVDDDPGRQSFRAGELECPWRSPLCKEALSYTQQDLIGKPVFEQHRCQRRAAPDDQVRSVLRLDAANALNDVRSKALERAPFKTFRTVGSDIFFCRVDAVRHRTARRLRPEARPEIVGAPAKQQIEALAIRCEDEISASGGAIGCCPVAVGVVAVFALDYAVQRDVFESLELSHCESPSVRGRAGSVPTPNSSSM